MFLDLVLAGILGVLVAMLPGGSWVQCVLRQLWMRALPGAARPSRSQHLFFVVLSHDVPLALPLEPPTCTGANTFPGLTLHSNSQWFSVS